MAAFPHPSKERLQTAEAPEFPGAPISIDSKFYIDRPPIEARAVAEIGKPGGLVRIKAPKKMGKSSLMLRLIDRATAWEYQTVTVDFQEADTAIFNDLEKFLRWFCANIARQLNLKPNLDDYWDEDMGSKTSCSVYFKCYLLAQIDRPLVLVLNEVNRVVEHPKIAQDFLPLLRFWHEQAKQDRTWQKLRLVALHSIEVFISLNINQSPFNVGLALKLPQFTPEQVQDFAQRHGLSWSRSSTLELMKMVGGQPYLVHLALYHLTFASATLEQLLQQAPTQTGIYGDHLRVLLAKLQMQPELAAAFKQAIDSKDSVCLDPIFAYQLESMGLVNLVGNSCTVSCELYRLYFAQNLALHHLNRSCIQKLEQENQKLQALANIDKLTQLPDRDSFNHRLQAEWNRMTGEVAPISLIACDIDYFKIYNNTYGHEAGDNCLRQLARIISGVLDRPADFAARYGADEFAIILPQTDATEAIQIAEKIRSAIASAKIKFNPPSIGGLPSKFVTLSLGVSSKISDCLSNQNSLVKAANLAVKESKRHRDCITFFPMNSRNKPHQ
jgi:diguanylate cyclase (GGDEF)-like protein